MVHRFVSLQVQDPAFAFAEFQKVLLHQTPQSKLRIRLIVVIKVKESFPAERGVKFVNCTNSYSYKNLTSFLVPLGCNVTEEVRPAKPYAALPFRWFLVCDHRAYLYVLANVTGNYAFMPSKADFGEEFKKELSRPKRERNQMDLNCDLEVVLFSLQT